MIIDARKKSLFLFPAAMIIMILLLVSVFQAIFDWNQRTAWIGSAIAALPMPILIGRLMMSPVERTSENLPGLLLLGGAGFFIAIWEQFAEWQTIQDILSAWYPTILATVSFGIFCMYVFWYSRFGRFSSSKLSVGSKLPVFELADSNGELFSSDSLVGAPAVLLFYRGNWCPLCMAQIKEVAGRYKDLEELGIQVILISPQSDEASHRLAERFEVPFKFLVDKDNKLAESLDIAVKNGVPVGVKGDYAPDTVMPTLLLTNAAGTIIFSDQTDNYRVRPEPDVYLSILRRSGALAQ